MWTSCGRTFVSCGEWSQESTRNYQKFLKIAPIIYPVLSCSELNGPVAQLVGAPVLYDRGGEILLSPHCLGQPEVRGSKVGLCKKATETTGRKSPRDHSFNYFFLKFDSTYGKVIAKVTMPNSVNAVFIER